MRNSQRIPQNRSILENVLFQLPNFYVPRSISSFIEQHGTNMTAGDEVLKKLWSTEGGAQLCLKSTISHVGKKVVKIFRCTYKTKSYLFGDNRSVVTSSTLAHSTWARDILYLQTIELGKQLHQRSLLIIGSEQDTI